MIDSTPFLRRRLFAMICLAALPLALACGESTPTEPGSGNRPQPVIKRYSGDATVRSVTGAAPPCTSFGYRTGGSIPAAAWVLHEEVDGTTWVYQDPVSVAYEGLFSGLRFESSVEVPNYL